ncbi:hypothetical protein [Methylophilus sp.]|uniref:hypothetical protein n=1 Tax=Methylophilus sp. TaxID=29541 RepID=UPI00403516FC
MDKRIEKNYQSLLALKSLLAEINQHPANYLEQENVLAALKSQGALSKYLDESRGIYPSSINTQKRTAETIIEGGYETVDKLRLAAQLSIEKKFYENKQPKKDSKTGLKATIEHQNEELLLIRNDLLLLTLAFQKSLVQGLNYATNADHATLTLCKKEQRELLDFLSLRNNVLNTNLVSIHEEKL